jgi:hypothetical protein
LNKNVGVPVLHHHPLNLRSANNSNKSNFSLERIQKGEFCFSTLSQEEKARFAEGIFKRRDKTWAEVKSMPRHALGFEKIAKKSICAQLPSFITDDMDHFLAFRFDGMKPMIGYRLRNIFYVLWFDAKFTLYDHG